MAFRVVLANSWRGCFRHSPSIPFFSPRHISLLVHTIGVPCSDSSCQLFARKNRMLLPVRFGPPGLSSPLLPGAS